jgi:hypothetical protein
LLAPTLIVPGPSAATVEVMLVGAVVAKMMAVPGAAVAEPPQMGDPARLF